MFVSVFIVKASILLESEIVSDANLSETYCVLARRPVVGKLILLAPVVLNEISPTPLKEMFCATEIVLPLLLTPVPPFALGTMVLIDIAESAIDDLDANNA